MDTLLEPTNTQAYSFEAGHFWPAEMARLSLCGPYVARLAAEPASPIFIILIHQFAVRDLLMTGDWLVFIDQPNFVQ